MKKNSLKVFVLAVVASFLAVSVTFSAQELSKAIFKVDTKNKEAKAKIETVVNMLKGVSEAEYDVNSKKLEVKYDSNQIDEGMIQFAVEALGYPVSKEKPEAEKKEKGSSNQDSTKK